MRIDAKCFSWIWCDGVLLLWCDALFNAAGPGHMGTNTSNRLIFLFRNLCAISTLLREMSCDAVYTIRKKDKTPICMDRCIWKNHLCCIRFNFNYIIGVVYIRINTLVQSHRIFHLIQRHCMRCVYGEVQLNIICIRV